MEESVMTLTEAVRQLSAAGMVILLPTPWGNDDEPVTEHTVLRALRDKDGFLAERLGMDDGEYRVFASTILARLLRLMLKSTKLVTMTVLSRSF